MNICVDSLPFLGFYHISVAISVKRSMIQINTGFFPWFCRLAARSSIFKFYVTFPSLILYCILNLMGCDLLFLIFVGHYVDFLYVLSTQFKRYYYFIIIIFFSVDWWKVSVQWDWLSDSIEMCRKWRCFQCWEWEKDSCCFGNLHWQCETWCDVAWCRRAHDIDKT